MPTYRDASGKRYWFDTPPEPGMVRRDLTQLSPEEETKLAVQEGRPVPNKE